MMAEPLEQPVLVTLYAAPDQPPLRFPEALNRRLHTLLDKQNNEGVKLTDEEKAEAEGLVEIAELLSFLKLSVEVAQKDKSGHE